jgi:hypothetical protein
MRSVPRTLFEDAGNSVGFHEPVDPGFDRSTGKFMGPVNPRPVHRGLELTTLRRFRTVSEPLRYSRAPPKLGQPPPDRNNPNSVRGPGSAVRRKRRWLGLDVGEIAPDVANGGLHLPCKIS